MSPTTMLVLILIAAAVILAMVLDGLFFKQVFHKLKARWWFLLSIVILLVGNQFVRLTTRENLNQPVPNVLPSILLFILGGITIAIGFTRLAPWDPGKQAKTDMNG